MEQANRGMPWKEGQRAPKDAPPPKRKNTFLIVMRAILAVLIAGAAYIALPMLLKNVTDESVRLVLQFLLLYVVFAVAAFFSGFAAGASAKELFFLPLIEAGLFVLGALTILEPIGVSYFIFAGVYLVIAIIGLLVRHAVCGRREKHRAEPPAPPQGAHGRNLK